MTDWFRVKNVDRLKVVIDQVSDPVHDDEGFNGADWEVYRVTTTITLTGTYQDITQTVVPDRNVTISYNDSTSGPYKLTSVLTDSTYGNFSVDVSLPASTALDNITIYAWDTTIPDPIEERVGVENILVMTQIDLSDYSRSGTFNGNAVYVGENVHVSGTLIDDQGVSISSAELTNRLRVIGWDGSQENGTAVTGSPDGSGAYNFSFQVPLDYTGDTLFIRLNITTSATLYHYRLNYTQISIDVYRDYQIVGLQIYLPHNGSTISVSNNSVYMIFGVDHRTIYVSGNLNDTATPVARRLSSKYIDTSWNGTASPLYLDTNGFFNISYSFTGWINVTWEWEFYHILDNGTILTKYYFITFGWEVYDTSEPSITIISPINFPTTQWLPNNDTTNITVNVTDPSNAMGYVSVGVDNTSVTIWINGTGHAMTQGSGSLFYYNWDTSSVGDLKYNITITALDVRGNWNSTGSFIRVIDTVVPSITPSTSQYNNSYAPVSLGENLTIEANITDSDSLTLINSGINTSTLAIWIDGTNFSMTYLSGDRYIYNWDTTTAVDKIYNITFSTYDNAGNWFVTGPYIIILDIIAPSLTSNITQYNNSYAPVSLGENLTIEANITDSDSLTLINSGVNTSSVVIWIDETSFSMTNTTGSTYVYDWDTSTAIDKVYNITIVTSDNAGNWNTTGTILVVIDVIVPSITNNITRYHNKYVDFPPGVNEIRIEANITDSSSFTPINSGVDTSTITLWINGTSHLMTNTSGSMYIYRWDISGIEDKVYNITIDASDKVGNSNTTGSIMVVLDVVNPSAMFDEPDKYDSGYLRLNSEGKVVISGTIDDSNSTTGINSGLDNTSVKLKFRGKGESDIINEDDITVTAGSFSYEWSILDPDTYTRDYTEFSAWEVVLTFSDNVGNSEETILEVQLDNEAPNLGFDNEDEWALPNVVTEEELTVELTINDGRPDPKSGYNISTLVIDLVVNETGETIYSRNYANLTEEGRIIETGIGATITLDIPEEKEVYYLKAHIFDNYRNQKEIESKPFSQSTVTPPPLTVDLFWYIIGIPLALGGGVGFAALFERLRGLRGA